eukprot:200836-Chlamydomonas_euryale.AAC.1
MGSVAAGGGGGRGQEFWTGRVGVRVEGSGHTKGIPVSSAARGSQAADWARHKGNATAHGPEPPHTTGQAAS